MKIFRVSQRCFFGFLLPPVIGVWCEAKKSRKSVVWTRGLEIRSSQPSPFSSTPRHHPLSSPSHHLYPSALHCPTSELKSLQPYHLIWTNNDVPSKYHVPVLIDTLYVSNPLIFKPLCQSIQWNPLCKWDDHVIPLFMLLKKMVVSWVKHIYMWSIQPCGYI